MSGMAHKHFTSSWYVLPRRRSSISEAFGSLSEGVLSTVSVMGHRSQNWREFPIHCVKTEGWPLSAHGNEGNESHDKTKQRSQREWTLAQQERGAPASTYPQAGIP